MKDLYQILDELGIEHEKYEHPAVFTAEEAKNYLQRDAAHSKNLFLRNRKGNKHYLVVLEASKRINLDNLASSLGEADLSFASNERMLKYLGLTPGSVSPFGLINDGNHEVQVIIDNDLLKYDKQAFHPNINTATLVITTADLKKFLESTGNQLIYFDC